MSGYFQIQAPQTPQKQRRAAALKNEAASAIDHQ